MASGSSDCGSAGIKLRMWAFVFSMSSSRFCSARSSSNSFCASSSRFFRSFNNTVNIVWSLQLLIRKVIPVPTFNSIAKKRHDKVSRHYLFLISLKRLEVGLVLFFSQSLIEAPLLAVSTCCHQRTFVVLQQSRHATQQVGSIYKTTTINKKLSNNKNTQRLK